MRRKFILMLLAGIFLLTGCALEDETSEDFLSFTLVEMGTVSAEDEETPVLYIVDPEEAKDQVVIFRNERVDEMTFTETEEQYDLEDVTVTKDEIILTYDGQEDHFKRLSSSVVENEDKVQYEYHGPEL